MMHSTTTSNALSTLFMEGRLARGSDATLTDRLLKSSDALANIPIIDVHRVNLGKTLQRRHRFPRRFLGHAQIIPQCERTFRVQVGSVQRTVVPDGGDPGLSFFHESQP